MILVTILTRRGVPRISIGGPHHPQRRLQVVGDDDDGDDPRAAFRVRNAHQLSKRVKEGRTKYITGITLPVDVGLGVRK